MALAVVPLTPAVAAADSDYAASCSVLLRVSPSTSAPSLVTMPTGTVVTTTGTVSGEPWSATCTAAVSGSDWYAITAVDGTSVSTLYGVSVAYAAAGLFQLSLSPPPTPAVVLEGIDVSHYQGTIDWTQVPAAGKRFAIMQATVGETYVDPTYAANHAGARAAGLPIGAYHFAFPLGLPNDAVLQADWFADNAALLPGDLVPALDLERTGGLSTSDLQAWVGAWLGEVYAKLGVRPMIYTSPTFWTNSMGSTTMFADQGFSVLWIAHWRTSTPTLPAGNWGGHGWTFWQYSNCGAVTGITGCVDLDRFNGSDLSSVAFNYTYVPPPIPPPIAPPIVTAIAPTTVPAGGGDLVLSIQGAAFAPGVSVAFWNGIPLGTAFVSSTQLSVVVPAALTAAAGTGSVTVLNELPGGGSSAPAAFVVTAPPNPPPVLDGIAPTTARAGGGDLTVSIQGAAFAPGISAFWNGTPLATTYLSPTQLTAIVPAALTATPGTGSVTVLNQLPGGGSSAPAAFVVTTPTPLLMRSIGVSSALGLRPKTGYSTRTPKAQATGKYVTWRFSGGKALAGQRVNVMVAKKVAGTWGSPRYLKSAWADAKGVVTFWYMSGTSSAINVRVQWAGSDTYGVSTSTACGAYWR